MMGDDSDWTEILRALANGWDGEPVEWTDDQPNLAAEVERLRQELRSAKVFIKHANGAAAEQMRNAAAARAVLAKLWDAVERAAYLLSTCGVSSPRVAEVVDVLEAALAATPADLAVAHDQRLKQEMDSERAAILRLTGAAIGVGPVAAVKALVADRDACSQDRDALASTLAAVLGAAQEAMDRRDECFRAAWPALEVTDREAIAATNLRQVLASVPADHRVSTREQAAEDLPWGALPSDRMDPNWGRVCGRCNAPIRAGARYMHRCRPRSGQ